MSRRPLHQIHDLYLNTGMRESELLRLPTDQEEAIHFAQDNLEDCTQKSWNQESQIQDLPHTFGARAAGAGVPLPAIRDVMNHGSIRMTERYAHATDEGKRRVVEGAVEKWRRSSKWRQKKW